MTTYARLSMAEQLLCADASLDQDTLLAELGRDADSTPRWARWLSLLFPAGARVEAEPTRGGPIECDCAMDS